MSAETYIIETLEIELNRLRYEDRSSIHYISRNENNEVSKDRWENIHALEKTIIYHKKLLREDKYWDKGNQFNSVDRFWSDNK